MASNLVNIIDSDKTIKEALKALDYCGEKLLLVKSKANKFLGTLSDGDIRRALLKGLLLNNDLDGVYNKDSISLNTRKYTKFIAEKICKEKKILGLPVLDDEQNIIDFYSYVNDDDVLIQNLVNTKLPVVIMGGGKGTRMKPISDVFPKPLIPINGKPMINHVIDFFAKYGFDQYYLTLNYKSNLMVAYFNSLENKNYKVDFAIEPEFMGLQGV